MVIKKTKNLKKISESHHSKLKIVFIGILLFVLLVLSLFFYFSIHKKNPSSNISLKNNSNTGIANPASVYCIENNGTLEIRSDEQGGQYGVCISLESKKECEEWAFFRGECIL